MRTLEAIGHREAFGLNWDPSHMVWQDLDPVGFLWDFQDRIYHVDCKDTKKRMATAATAGSARTCAWADPRRGWDFISTGHGDVPWEDAFRMLNPIGYDGPISVEWEDAGMDRLIGAPEALEFVRRLAFDAPDAAFDAAFSTKRVAAAGSRCRGAGPRARHVCGCPEYPGHRRMRVVRCGRASDSDLRGGGAPMTIASMFAGERAWWMASMLAPSTAASGPGLGLRDLQVLGGERHRARVDDLAHAGDEVLAGLGERAADDDDRRVDEAHAGGEHLADVAAGLAHGLDGVDVAALDELDDVLARVAAASPVSRRARAIAGPEASASRHPRLPHWQGTSAPRAT